MVLVSEFLTVSVATDWAEVLKWRLSQSFIHVSGFVGVRSRSSRKGSLYLMASMMDELLTLMMISPPRR